MKNKIDNLIEKYKIPFMLGACLILVGFLSFCITMELFRIIIVKILEIALATL